MISRAMFLFAAVLLAPLPQFGFVRSSPDSLAIHVLLKPNAQHLQMLVRVPLTALNTIDFPTQSASPALDLTRSEALLPSAARWWIADHIELYENDNRLPKPQVAVSRLSLPSDNAFASYETALAHLTSERLPTNSEVFIEQAVMDVLFDYSIGSPQSSFAIQSGLARLAGTVTTNLRFFSASGQTRAFEFSGDPGMFYLEPSWLQAAMRSVTQGFLRMITGIDHLIFLFLAALLLRGFRSLLLFTAVFAVAHSATLIAAVYNLDGEALWFPLLVETLAAAALIVLAFEIIAFGTRSDSNAQNRRYAMAVFAGLIYGFHFCYLFRPELLFTGTHRLVSTLSFNVGIELAMIAVIAPLAPVLHFLLRFSKERRVEAIVLAAFAADVAWHRFSDRASRLAQFRFQLPVLDAGLLSLVLRWTAILLVIAGATLVVFGVLRKWTLQPGLESEEGNPTLSGGDRHSVI